MDAVNTKPRTMTPSHRFGMAALLGMLTALGPLSIDMYLPALPALANDLHTSTSLAQLSLTACLLGLAFGQLLVGPISDIHGRRTPLITSLVVYASASILCALVPSIWALILLRFAQGMAGSGGIVIARAIVRDLYSGSEIARFFSLLMLVNGLAPILAPVIGGQLLRITSWHGVILVLGILSIAILLTVAFKLPETLPSQYRSEGSLKQTFSTFRGLITDREFMGFAWSQGLVMAAMFAYISGSPFVLQNIFGVSPQGFSLFFAVNAIGLILASQITGRLVGRISETKLLTVGIVYAAIGGTALLTAILLGVGLVGIIPSLFVVVSSVGIVVTTCFSLAMQNQARSAGSASALLGVIPFVMGAMVAPLVGVGGSDTAVPMGIVIASCDIGALLSYFVLVRR
jgi:DHA1 family bicyclomycin/chloramphenicol resistance-like MFS transporter